MLALLPGESLHTMPRALSRSPGWTTSAADAQALIARGQEATKLSRGEVARRTIGPTQAAGLEAHRAERARDALPLAAHERKEPAGERHARVPDRSVALGDLLAADGIPPANLCRNVGRDHVRSAGVDAVVGLDDVVASVGWAPLLELGARSTRNEGSETQHDQRGSGAGHSSSERSR